MPTQRVLEDRPALQAAARRFEAAAKASRDYDELAERCLQRYGDHGPFVSGCCREHFPEREKQKLRALARIVAAENAAGRRARPHGVHKTTMDKLARSIFRRDGSGWYGYQVGEEKTHA